MISNKFKNDDEYGDYLLEQKRDENAQRSEDNIKPVQYHKCDSCGGFNCVSHRCAYVLGM